VTGRVLELVLALLIVAAIITAGYRIVVPRPLPGGVPSRPPELDVSRTPSMWFTDSRTIDETHTEICIVRVETKTGVVAERRVLQRLANDDPDYRDALDKAMDAAYEAARVANLNLFRR
jgi:hypothetical protein